jgi:hypothetical protein
MRPALTVLLLGAVLVVTSPAQAHEADPRIVTTLDAVEPALPADVVVQVQAGIATQLVASNPTPTVLEVLDDAGRPFLRLSSGGVQGDVGSAAFFTTSNPTGAASDAARDRAPRWVRISGGHSWGWYDHRLHPAPIEPPADVDREVRLGGWEVPLRYGDQEVAAVGSIRFRPLLGSFLVSVDPAPEGLTVQALQGRLPGLFLSAEPGTPVTVLGRDGERFLRISDAGVEVNRSSRTHVEDRAARGEVAGPPSTTPDFHLVAPGGRTYTWLDTRLRYPSDLPPEDVLRVSRPTSVQRWEVPVRVGERALALTGEVTWVPEADAAARVGAVPAPSGTWSWLPYTLVAAAVLTLAAATVALRRRRAAQRHG